jgi:hypothetical protein
MMNHAELTKLEHSLRDRTVLSVYVNGEIADAAARGQWRTELRNSLDAIAELLRKAPHQEREDFARTRELVERALLDFEAGDGSPGWMGLFTPDEVHHAAVVPVPVPTQATWAKGANLAPCIRVLKEGRPVLLVVADKAHVRIHRYVDRTVSLVESFNREVSVDTPYHMSRPAPQGFSSGTRGRPGADAAQRELRKGTDSMLAEAVARVEELAGADAWILVGGTTAAASALHGRLNSRLAARATVVPLDVHATDAVLAETAREHATRLRAREDLQRVEQVVSDKARGSTGAVGVEDIERALVNGQVRELYLTSAFVQDHSEEAVDAIRRAFDEGAKVEHVSGDAAQRLDAAGGIAARLRFTISSDGSGGSAAAAP